jgi:predicted phosphodiesterase
MTVPQEENPSPMRYAVLSDIHGRRPAMLKALSMAEAQGAERVVMLGDYVGYMGSDPVGVVETAMFLESEGAICLRGNHDQALSEVVAGGQTPEFSVMNVLAQQGVVRDAQLLEPTHLEWLASRPYTVDVDDVVFSHGAIPDPEAFRYPTGNRADTLFEPRTFLHVQDIGKALQKRGARILCHGHTHRPLLYFVEPLRPEQCRQIQPDDGVYSLPTAGAVTIVDVGSAGAIRTNGPESLIMLEPDADAEQLKFLRFEV